MHHSFSKEMEKKKKKQRSGQRWSEEKEASKDMRGWGGMEGGGVGSTLWVAESDPPLLSSDWRQSVLGAWAEGRDGWGVGAKEWEVIGGALHWLTKRQCSKIKPVGREMAQSFLYIFSLHQKDCGNNNRKWHMLHLWRQSPSLHFPRLARFNLNFVSPAQCHCFLP